MPIVMMVVVGHNTICFGSFCDDSSFSTTKKRLNMKRLRERKGLDTHNNDKKSANGGNQHTVEWGCWM